jgi:hypothetical protein
MKTRSVNFKDWRAIMLRREAFRALLAMLGLVCIIGLPSLLFAQDPGIQDSMIIGHLDHSVILAGLNMPITVPVYIRTDDSVTFAHIPVGTDDDYIASRDGGVVFPPFSLWDDVSFLAPDSSSPRVGFTSQSILGFAYLFDPRDPQNFLYTNNTWVHIADFHMTTTGNIAVLGDTTTLVMGRNPANDTLTLGLQDGVTEVHPAIIWGQIFFPPNNPPVFSSPDSGTYQINEQFAADFIVTATDPDTDSMVLTVDFGPTNYTFQEIQDVPGTISYDFHWVPSPGSAGTYPLTFTVNDGNGGVIPLNLTLVVTPPGLVIDSLASLPGGTVSIPVVLDDQGSSSAVGAFDILISWNPEALSLNGVTRAGRTGSFEYFHINRDDGGPGTVRIVGIADIRNGVVSPPMQPGIGPIFMLEMSVAPDEGLIGVNLPVRFLNAEPSDNTLSDSTGYLLIHPDLTDGVVSVIGPGDVLIGDINQNGEACEVGDVVLFVNHLTNPVLFPFNTVQRAASDVNQDGLPETVADLVYLINIVNGNIDWPLIEPGSATFDLQLLAQNGQTRFIAQSSSLIGAVLVKLAHQPGAELTPISDGVFTLAFHDDGSVLTVLAYLPDLPNGPKPSGACNLFSVDGNFTETSVTDLSASTAYGLLMTTEVLPQTYRLAQNYPNPFNATTKIDFGLPEASHVRIDIYDITGKMVCTLLDEDRAAGFYSLNWNGTDNYHNTVASGVYFYRLTSGNNVRTMKMTLLK